MIYTAILCGNMPLLNSLFERNEYTLPKDITSYAVACGHIQVIQYLHEKKFSFNNMFYIAVAYHNNNLFDYLLEIGEQTALYENTCNALFNHEAYIYIEKNIDKFKGF